MALLETRVKAHNKDRVVKKFGNSWSWVHNYEASSRGRIWIAWNPSTVSVQILLKTAQIVHCRVGDKQAGTVTVVYGLHTMDDQKSLWVDLGNLDKSIQEPWVHYGGL